MDNIVTINNCAAFLTIFLHLATSQKLMCSPGTFLYTDQHLCIECQDGTYMPYKDHQQTACRPCENIKDFELEILVSLCNKTHDAVIHCVDGYYRDEARNPRETGQCKKCTQCEFVGLPCSTYKDTVCCWDENFDVSLNHDGVPVCRERPWFCRQGQYFDTSGYQCLPCPDNTFMPLDHHIKQKCWDCRDDQFEAHRPLHSVIIQPCNSTHAPVIRCEDGFFMNPKMSYTNDALGCSPCTDCSTTDVQYEGRKCDGMEDTVCCPETNMTVVDTPDGPVCTSSHSDCGDGHCLHHYVRTNVTICAPCMGNADIDTTTTAPRDHRHVLSTTDRGFLEAKDAHDTRGTVARNKTLGLVSTLFIGLVTGVVFVLACICYRKRWIMCAQFRYLACTIVRGNRGDSFSHYVRDMGTIGTYKQLPTEDTRI